ncbi:MAG: MFS transporter [Candidatus Omnitrophica bacterium]|jgi:MFS family permease|nr:MFS transporter [Candidatus Omnitrophota bacterium]
MRLQTIFQPKHTLSRDEVRRGLRALTWEGIVSTGFSSLTNSTFLVAFALALGANNFHIGVLASLPFITDLFQVPSVWLVERLRRRKIVVIVTWFISLLLWIPIALIPVVMKMPGTGAISILLGLMALRGTLNALTNCGWSSWKRDLVPQTILGRYFARRLSLASTAAIVLGLSAGFFLDYWSAAGSEAIGYSFVFLFGLVFLGLASPVLMLLVPEPTMLPTADTKTSIVRIITSPIREQNYRYFMKFLMFWGFASNMAIPFFAVFMLQYLKLTMLTVITLTMISEAFTIISLRFWGPFADRFGSKIAIYFSTSIFLLSLIGWTFTAIPGNHALIIPMLVILHVFTGIAVAGITLTVGTLSFKLAPYGRATPYLTCASLADSAGTGLGALAGGVLADLFASRAVVLDLSWAGGFQPFQLDSLHLTGYHFLFALAFIVGMITLRTLEAVYEKGAIQREAVLPTLMAHFGTFCNRVNLAPDSTYLSIFPLRRVLGKLEAIDIAVSRWSNLDSRVLQVVPAAVREKEKKPPSCENNSTYPIVLEGEP